MSTSKTLLPHKALNALVLIVRCVCESFDDEYMLVMRREKEKAWM